MKRLAVLFLFLAPSVWAQQPPAKYVFKSPVDPWTCNGAQEGSIYQNTTSHTMFYCNGSAWTSATGGIGGSGTANTLAKFTASTTIGNATPLTSTDSVAGDGTTNFLGLTGTLPSVTTAAVTAAKYSVTSAGSSSQQQHAMDVLLNAGYTGSSLTTTSLFQNFAVGTGADTTWNGIAGNNAVTALSSGQVTAGSVVGVTGYARHDGSGDSYGVFGSVRDKGGSGVAFGVFGAVNGNWATGSFAGFFTVSGGAVTHSSMPNSALLGSYNNTDIANGLNLFSAIFGHTTPRQVYALDQFGGQWAANAKTLTETTATAFARFTIASGSSGGLNVDYCIEANDSTDFQSRCGFLPVAVVNKGGTITCTVGTVAASSEVVAVSAGTLTNTFTCTDSGTNFLDIKANATSSLTQTTLRINYFPRQQGNAAVAFTPQ